MFWPSSSLNLNSIENIWQILKERIRRRLRSENRPHNVYKLQQLVQVEWNKLTLEEIRRHVDSMPERMEAVLKIKEDILVSEIEKSNSKVIILFFSSLSA